MRLSLAVYRCLLHAYPRRFRLWAGREMELAFEDRLRELRAQSVPGKARLWTRTLGDVARNATRERWDVLRRRNGLMGSNQGQGNKGGIGMESTWQDLRYALRIFRKSPGFLCVAVASLALGIGATTSIFSLMEAALLRDLPVPEPRRLALFRYEAVRLPSGLSHDGWIQSTDAGLRTSTSLPYPFYQSFRDQADGTFSSVFAFAKLYRVNLALDGAAELSDGIAVSGNYFSGLRLAAPMGRLIEDEDDRPGAESVVVLSHSYWQRRFGGNPDAVGRPVRINGKSFVIIGVTPARFQGTLQVGDSPSVFIPLSKTELIDPRGNRLADSNAWWLQVMGRLGSGIRRQRAEQQMNLLFQAQVAANWPEYLEQEGSGIRLLLQSGSQGMTEVRGNMSRPLWIAMLIGAMVLLIACANLANLLLARGAARRKELALRLSLGAMRRRLVRQLLTESVLLALFGGILGVLLATVFGGLLRGLLPRELGETLHFQAGLNGGVLAFSLLLSLGTSLLFGLAPAWMVSRVELAPAIRDAQAFGSEGARFRPSRLLVVAQVALCLVLLVVAGLLGRTLLNLRGIDPGFNPTNLLVFRIDPTLNGYRGAKLAQFYSRLREELQAIPNVESATLSPFSLLSGAGSWTSIYVQGQAPDDEAIGIHVHRVAPNFLKTMQIPLLAGRDLRESDDLSAPPVAVVNQTLARRIEASGQPVGRFFGSDRESNEIEIVGVSRDAKNDSLRREILPTVYLPYTQSSRSRAMSVSLRHQGLAESVMAVVRKKVAGLDPLLPLFEVRSMEQQISESLLQERLFARMTVLFSVTALALACIGLYGVLSHAMGRRRREFGIRMALGAREGELKRLVMREMTFVLVGIVLGGVAAWMSTRWVESLLFDLSPLDPLSFILAAGVMLAVAAWTTYLPARKAARIDPVEALRCE